MPRKPRIQHPGAIYPVMSRGDRREDLFLDDVDRYDFLKPKETILQIVHRVHLGTSRSANALHAWMHPRRA